ncbi:hypothetical protein GCM10020218_078470 [Dactylosporangium vinaceum]
MGAEHVAVVGHGQRGLAEPGSLRKQRAEARGPVEHRILGMNVQMNEAHGSDATRGVRQKIKFAGAASLPPGQSPARRHTSTYREADCTTERDYQRHCSA